MLISFGHDEAIFRKNIFSGRGWRGPDGESKCLPKEDGIGVMVSALQSREFGFGLRELSEEEWKKVNDHRASQEYLDKDAAKMIQGSAKKKPLESDPFKQYFQYGAAKDGYWSYEHLVCQLEDCQDVMRVLYSDFAVRYNVDHSCGHDRQKEDGLNTNNMR